MISSWVTKNSLKTLLIFMIIFIGVFTLNWDFRYHPPVWDTIAGVFSPANYLYETGFNFSSLVKEDGYSRAGPNGHVYSPITILTAISMWAMNGNQSSIYLFLHTVQFTLATILLAHLFKFLKSHFSLINTSLILLSVLLFPPFLVQTRYMYMELLGALCMLTSFTAWVQQRYNTATLIAIAACAIKSFGLVLVVALIPLFLLDKGRKQNRVYLSAIMFFSSIGFEVLRWSQGTNLVSLPHSNYNTYITEQFFSRLLKTPDLYILLMLVLIGSGYYIVTNIILPKTEPSRTRIKNILTDINHRILFGGLFIILMFMAFIVTVPLSGKLFYPLTRYYIWIWPVLILVFFVLLKLFTTKKTSHASAPKTQANRTTMLTAIALIVFFSSNISGRFYPSFQQGLTSFSIAERSMEYQEFNKMQRYLIRSASKLENRNVYLNRFDIYYTSSPIMGYLDKKYANFKNILTYHKNPGDLSQYPDSFSLVFSNVSHGGQYMYMLIEQAKRSKTYNIDFIDTYNKHGFSGLIIDFNKNK